MKNNPEVNPILPKNATLPSLSWLNEDVLRYLGPCLDKQSLGRISQTGKGAKEIFKTSLKMAKAEELLKQVMFPNPKKIVNLLDSVMRGRWQRLTFRNSIDYFLFGTDPSAIVLKKVKGEEACMRKWKSVSPLEFAAWSGDTDVVLFLLQATSNAEKGKALEQLEVVLAKGTENGPFLSPYVSLINAYNEFFEKLNQMDWQERNNYFVSVIGLMQLNLPIVGLQYICQWGSFDPVPSFKYPPERKNELKCHQLRGEEIPLMPLIGSGLANLFALCKGDMTRAYCISKNSPGWWCKEARKDLIALQHLRDVKKQELDEIIANLKQSIDNEAKGCLVLY